MLTIPMLALIVAAIALVAVAVPGMIRDTRNTRRELAAADATARAYVAYCDAGVNPYRAHALAVSNRRAARVA